MNNVVLMALVATLGTWFITALGAATVLFIRRPNQSFLNLMLGFSAGVMIAASFWSLLQPAIERAENTLSVPSYIVVTLGFLFGAIFIWISDRAVTYAFNRADKYSNNNNKKISRVIMLIMSITLHNIPEGIAIGVAFGNNLYGGSLIAAISLTLGIAIQNFPEGAAISIPLKRDNISCGKAFFLGSISGIGEPIFAVIGSLLILKMKYLLTFILSFAAGAMIFVTVFDLIPESQSSEKKDLMAILFIIGFVIMMSLDVLLG